MRQIYIDTNVGLFHPCEVECVKYNQITNKYHIYFYDRSMGEFCFAELKKINGEFFVMPPSFQSEKNFFTAVGSLMLPKLDITTLPPFLKSIKYQKVSDKDIILKPYTEKFKFLINKLEYLEVESVANALVGSMYYYFIVDEMNPKIDGFEYYGRLVAKSCVPLKKNIIARHRTDKDLSSIKKTEESIPLSFPEKDNLHVNMKVEGMLVKKIMELEHNRRSELDPVVLTSVVRKMLAESDHVKAAREYQEYLKNFYDPVIEERKRNK